MLLVGKVLEVNAGTADSQVAYGLTNTYGTVQFNDAEAASNQFRLYRASEVE